MSEKIIHTSIPDFWLDTLNEEVKPLLKRTEFFIDLEKSRVHSYNVWRSTKCISVRLELDDDDDKNEFLFELAGKNLEEVYEKALKEFVLDRIGHRI
jgi:hypothetical protein